MVSRKARPRVFVHADPVNMCKSFDGLIALAREFMPPGPLEDHLFVFRNKAGDRLKLLYWDAEGVAVWYKRFHSGSFASKFVQDGRGNLALDLGTLAEMLEGARFKRR